MAKKDTLVQNASSQIAPRVQILNQAAELTSQDREKTYGPPKTNMECYAQFVNVYVHFCAQSGKHCTFDAHDAAILNVLAKIARIACGPRGHKDNYIDSAAYFAIASEVDE